MIDDHSNFSTYSDDSFLASFPGSNKNFTGLKMKTYFSIAYFILLASSIIPQETEHYSTKLAKAVVNRIITETTFELKDVNQKAELDIQVINFPKTNLHQDRNHSIAESILNITADSKILFGISSDHPIKILIDNQSVYKTSISREFKFAEIAYEIFDFQDTIKVNLSAGSHRIKILNESDKLAKVYLREISGAYIPPNASFISIHPELKSPWNWCYYANENKSEPDHKNCSVLPVETLKRLDIPSANTYQRENYCEWQYPNGSLLMSILELSNTLQDDNYKDFVRNCADFTVNNYNLFKKQYFEMQDFRGTNHKMFRKCMLDDSGSPALFLQQLALQLNTRKYDWLINDMDDYITNRQVRLKDGTFSRPEPERYVVWADDLFMSVPFLLRMGALTQKESYYDDVVNQIINMNKYLTDSEKGIYHHAWYDYKKEQSPILWGRANGWIIWAEAEALKHLPKQHKSYKKIQEIIKNHLQALSRYQGKNGLWHQVLDDTTSFEETSCTAMFITGFIRAIDSGILDSSYKSVVNNAWKGLQSKISGDGIVIDICRGTGISDDINFYKTRERFPNDPRGLGAVLTALNEITNYYSKNN